MNQTTSLYAHVVVDIPSLDVDRHFDYLAPDRLRARLQVGAVVAVPFGRLTQLGYVVALSTASEHPRIREIKELVCEEPVFDGPSLGLCRWIGEHYVCSLSSALRLVLPPGSARKIERFIRLPAGKGHWSGASPPRPLPAPDESLLRRIEGAGGEVRTGELLAVEGAKAEREALRRRLRRLEQAGLIEKFGRLSPTRVRSKKLKWVRLAITAEEALGLARAPASAGVQERPLTPGQSEVVEMLVSDGPRPLKDLPHAVRSLIKRGLVLVEERSMERLPSSAYAESGRVIILTPEQEAAISRIDASVASGAPRAFLLQGVTGSGKTEVYLRSIASALEAGKSAIVLVPEIALTPQTVARFRARFGGSVAILHSGLSPGERYDQWMGLKEGRYRIAIGPRSALFAPLTDLGLIVVDEEHQTTYKQSNEPRYHAREVALKRAELTGATVVFGSATPSIELMRAATEGRLGSMAIERLELPKRVASGTLPQVKLVDMRDEDGLLSGALEDALRKTFDQSGQAILLLNRRGFASFLLCRKCGAVPQCPNCAVSLTYHGGGGSGGTLRCHHCDHAQPLSWICPSCGGNLKALGAGTQKVESLLEARFPRVPLFRMDADTTTRKGSHEEHLNAFRESAPAMLLGTQMVAHGLDFPEVTLVGVINADVALNLADFRASERTLQLLMQVSGRAGRGSRPGKVFVQTYCPHHPALKGLVRGDYGAFCREETGDRLELGYPPFSSLVNIIVSSPDPKKAEEAVERLARALRQSRDPAADQVLGPAPCPLGRLKNYYRYHVLIKSAEPEKLTRYLHEHRKGLVQGEDGRSLRVAIDVDPAWVL